MKNRCLSLVLALVIVITAFSSCSGNESPEATLKNIESVVYEKYGNDNEHVYFADTYSGSMLDYIEYDALNSENSRLGLNYKIRIYYLNDFNCYYGYENNYNMGSPVKLVFYSNKFSEISNVVEENFSNMYNNINIDLESCENDSGSCAEIHLYFPPDKSTNADESTRSFEADFEASFGWDVWSPLYKYDCAEFGFLVDGNYEEIKSFSSIKDLFDPSNFLSWNCGRLHKLKYDRLGERVQEYYTNEQIGQIGRKILNDLMYDFNTCLQSEFGVTLKNLGFENYEF